MTDLDLDKEWTFSLSLTYLLRDPGLREAARTDARTRQVLAELADALRALGDALGKEAGGDGDRRLLAAPEASA